MRHMAFITIYIVTGFMFTAGQALAGLDVLSIRAKGQTKEQQEQDEFTCYKWGKEQTGFDPTQTVQEAAPPQQHGQVVGGAARGAALGAIGGAIAGDAGKGAAVGAAVGGGAGAMKRGRQARQAEAAQEKAEEKYEASLARYKRAFSVFMTGRGYTVS